MERKNQYNFFCGMKFYFVGVCGSGMSSIAKVLVDSGYIVFGWDDGADRVMLSLLEDQGVLIAHPSTMDGLGIDIVIYSTAIAQHHPSLLWARDNNVVIYHRSDILAWLSYTMPTIAVCGSHGKSTTVSMIDHILNKNNIQHVTILGGLLKGVIGGVSSSDPEYLLIEACESDRSFLKYHPKYVVLTNISCDHLEYYNNNLLDLISAFADWININNPTLIVINDQVNIQILLSKLNNNIKVYKIGYDYDYQVLALGLVSKMIFKKPGVTAEFLVNAPGSYNLANAAMALSLSDNIGIDVFKNPKIFEDYSRVGRRFEYDEFNKNNKKFHWISDYGHHPEELRAVISTIRHIWPDLPIKMVFEPHRYTRTHAHFDDFVDVLSTVDFLYLLPIYEASELPIQGCTSEALIERINKSNHSFVSSEKLNTALEAWLSEDAVIVFQGAGNVYKYGLTWLSSCGRD